MAGSGKRIGLDDALDVGSTASRGDVYDAAGRPVEGGRRKVPQAFRTGADGASEIDPDQVVDELGQIITGLAVAPLQGRVVGVALDAPGCPGTASRGCSHVVRAVAQRVGLPPLAQQL